MVVENIVCIMQMGIDMLFKICWQQAETLMIKIMWWNAGGMHVIAIYNIPHKILLAILNLLLFTSKIKIKLNDSKFISSYFDL